MLHICSEQGEGGRAQFLSAVDRMALLPRMAVLQAWYHPGRGAELAPKPAGDTGNEKPLQPDTLTSRACGRVFVPGLNPLIP